MLIAREAVNEYLGRRLDDHRWMKALRSERLLRELRDMRVRPRFKLDPWQHQLVCFYLGLLYPRFMFLLDMGAGKTKIIADLAYQLLREGKLDRALVTVPRMSNLLTWEDDLAKHSELEPCIVDCENIEEKYERIIKPRAEITVIDMAGLTLALCKKDKKRGKLVRDDKKVDEVLKRYNFLGIDEIHKLSSHDSLWYLLMNRLSSRMDFVYGATGTLFGKHVEHAHTEFYLVDQGETLGETLGLFRGAFCDAKSNGWSTEYKFRKDMQPTLNRMIQHRSIRYEDYEMHDLPPKRPRELHFEMEGEQLEHYNRALEGLINASGNLAELDASWLRMRQIVSGYLPWKDAAGEHTLHFKRNPKLDGLVQLADEMGDSKLVISYEYTQTGRMIVDRLKREGITGVEWLWGGSKDRRGMRDRFLKDSRSQILVMQSEAGGTGTDGLQDVARYLVFYETPSSPITRLQTEKRIGRPGQTRPWYVYDLIMRRSVDRGILDGIKEGVDVHSAVVNGRKQRSFYIGG